ncbi:MAG: aminoacyl-tRNA hydrolase [Armatimonadetes bacterium]|nr:aminoacyl-tRNA hydrolase [Armatimonadota bacterium]
MDDLTVIVGLGNPGRYARTRHNVGYEVVDVLSRQWNIPVRARKHHARTGSGEIEGRPVLLVKPETYMNNSGQAVQSVRDTHRLPAERLLVICDDIHLSLGKIRLRRNGSHGGQNGLRSIIEGLGTQDFPRMRLGIAEADLPPEQWVDFVLSKFTEEERRVIADVFLLAAEAAALFVTEGIESAMNKYN